MPAAMSGPSMRALGELLSSGRAAPQFSVSVDMPPPMPLDEVEAALNGARPMGRKPTYVRSRAPVQKDRGSYIETVPDAPPSFGSSYRDRLASLMTDGRRGDVADAPVRVDSQVRATLPDDPRGSRSGTITFQPERAGDGQRGRSIFDNPSGRDYLTAAGLRQEAMDSGEKNLPQLPGLRGVNMGTPAGAPVAGGQTDQYNQMKAAQRAAQMANQAKAPDLIMAREQMRKYGPHGAVMMRMLAGGQAGMDPTMLAAAGMGDAANASIQQQVANNQRDYQTGLVAAHNNDASVREKLGMAGVDVQRTGLEQTATQNAAANTLRQKELDIQQALGTGKITLEQAQAEAAKIEAQSRLLREQTGAAKTTAELELAQKMAPIKAIGDLVANGIMSPDEAAPHLQANPLLGGMAMNTPKDQATRALKDAAPDDVRGMIRAVSARPELLNDPVVRQHIVAKIGPEKLIQLAKQLDPTQFRLKTGYYPENRSLRTRLGPEQVFGHEPQHETQSRQSDLAIIRRLLSNQ